MRHKNISGIARVAGAPFKPSVGLSGGKSIRVPHSLPLNVSKALAYKT